jgi:phosphatidylserine/phosphatidylglycerophosphate/cardiolipin synthase-like enzyme
VVGKGIVFIALQTSFVGIGRNWQFNLHLCMNLCSRFVLLFLLSPFGLNAQNTISIINARKLPIGSQVSVRGIVTNGPELGRIRFLQDGTAGIAGFAGSGSAPGFENSVGMGDSVEISGLLSLFNGLLQISPVSAYTVIKKGNPLPQPKTVSLNDLDESLEGQLISVPCVSFARSGQTFAQSGVYDIYDTAGAQTRVYIRSENPLYNSTIPTQPVRLIGLLGKYRDAQILPRGFSDFASGASCFFFVEAPQLVDIQTHEVQVSWSTNQPANGIIRYGLSTGQLTNVIAANISNTQQTVKIPDLQPAQVYRMQAEASFQGKVIQSAIVPFVTQSTSSGSIKIYFNKAVQESILSGQKPSGQSASETLSEILARINAAEKTIDVAMYNNNRNDITAALRNAHNRGVRVRYIASDDTQNEALSTTPPFPVLYGNTLDLMHHKFMAIDAEIPEKAWVMSGSLNWTNQSFFEDANNILFIQDQSLAKCYVLEFEEMWGSNTGAFDLQKSRFGEFKYDNTPHEFFIGNRQVECYFSPSDNTTRQISRTIGSAQNEALFALFSYTKDEPSDALLEVYDKGATVRGMIENINDPGAEFNYLKSRGLSVQQHTAPGLLHHKYVVLDALSPSADPTVLTGSHNWTITAEISNDENTLVIHDPLIARFYKAEFKRRWAENISSTEEQTLHKDLKISPNPCHDALWITQAPQGSYTLKNMLGQCLFSRQTDRMEDLKWDLAGLPGGIYFISLQTQNGLISLPFQKI